MVRSVDGKEFEVSMAVVKMSEFMSMQADDGGALRTSAQPGRQTLLIWAVSVRVWCGVVWCDGSCANVGGHADMCRASPSDAYRFLDPARTARASAVHAGDEAVELPNVKSDVLKKILDWCEAHIDTKFPEVKRPLERPSLQGVGISKEDEDWVNGLSYEELHDVIAAANFMQVKDLLTLCCARIALWFKGKTPEEIKTFFDLKRDFTPEEEREVREKHPWAEKLAPTAAD